MLKSSHWNANLQLSCIKVILCRRSADRLDRLLLAIKPVVENRHSIGTDAAEVDIFQLAIFFQLIFGWQKFGGWAGYRLRLGALTVYHYNGAQWAVLTGHSTGSGFCLDWFSSVFWLPLCLCRCCVYLNIYVTFFTLPFSWIWCDCPLTWLTNHCPSVIWHLGWLIFDALWLIERT